MSADNKTGLQLRSLIKKSGELEISLASVPIPEPGPDEVVVRVEASPINPSDLGLLVGAADMSTAKASGTKEAPVVTAKVPEAAMKGMAGRLDQAMPVGNEGAGVVVKTGSSEAARALMVGFFKSCSALAKRRFRLNKQLRWRGAAIPAGQSAYLR